MVLSFRGEVFIRGRVRYLLEFALWGSDFVVCRAEEHYLVYLVERDRG